MYEIYIDKEFLMQLPKNSDFKSEEVQNFILWFLKKQRGVQVFINYTTLNEVMKDAELHEYISDVIEISPAKLLPNWQLLLNDKKWLDSYAFRVFLCNDIVDANRMCTETGLLFLNNINLKNQWKNLMIGREDDELSTMKSANLYFSNWSQLSSYSHPKNAILIFDKYLLGNKTNQSFEKNLYPMLQNILTPRKTYKVTIVSEEILPKDVPKGRVVDILPKVHTMIAEKLNLQNLSLEIVMYKTVKNKFLGEHDRAIYTNYMRIKCDQGFSIFEDNGQPANRSEISFSCMFKNSVRQSSLNALKNIGSYVKEIKPFDEVVVPGMVNGKLATQKIHMIYPSCENQLLLDVK